MNNVKIKLIDGNEERRNNIRDAIMPFNSLQPHQAYFRSILDKSESGNESTVKPEVFLLHINDQRKGGEPYLEYMQHINKDLPDALIVLYSGGTIDVSEQTTHYLKMSQAGKIWDFAVTNGNQFCIIPHRVDCASDLNIAPALQEYTDGATKEEFFAILLGSEMSQDHLAALAILCQGYLAVHAANADSHKDWNDADMASVLEQMGWRSRVETNASDALLVNFDFSSERDRVCEAKWWLDVFGDFATFYKGLRTGLDTIPSEVNDLLGLISKDVEIKPLKIVADAYRAIALRLERK